MTDSRPFRVGSTQYKTVLLIAAVYNPTSFMKLLENFHTSLLMDTGENIIKGNKSFF